MSENLLPNNLQVVNYLPNPREVVNEAHDRATEALTKHRDFLERMSKILIQTEVIDGGDLTGYFDGTKPIPSEEEIRQEVGGNGQRGSAVEETPTGPDVVLQPPP